MDFGKLYYERTTLLLLIDFYWCCSIGFNCLLSVFEDNGVIRDMTKCFKQHFHHPLAKCLKLS